MQKFGSKYFLIFSTTRDILAHPFSFGQRIDGSVQELRRAATYLGEGFLLFYSLIKTISWLEGQEAASEAIPFADEILALALVAGTAFTGMISHPFIRAFTGGNGSLYGTLTCFFYWSGFCIFVIPPIFAILLTGMDAVAGGGNLSENMQFFIVLFIGTPFMFVYYLGTICNWLAHVHQTEPIFAGLALIGAYLISSGVVALIGAGVKAVLGV